MKEGSGRRKLDRRAFTEQVRECRDKGYLLSSKKIGSGAFSKVYLAYATHERMKHNPKLASDLRAKRHTRVSRRTSSRGRGSRGRAPGAQSQPCSGTPPSPSPPPPTRLLLWLPPSPAPTSKPRLPAGCPFPVLKPLSTEIPRTGARGRSALSPEDDAHPASPTKFSSVHKGHRTCPATSCLRDAHSGYCPHLQVAIKIISTAEAPVEFSHKFLPREISSLNATYKHVNVVGRDLETSRPHPTHSRWTACTTLLLSPGPPPSPSGVLVPRAHPPS